MKEERHWDDEQQHQEAVYPETCAEINANRCNVKWIASKPEWPVGGECQRGLRGKDIRPNALHRSMSEMRKDSAAHEKHDTENTREQHWENIHRP